MSAKIKTAARSGDRQYKHKPKGVSTKTFERVHWPYLPMLLILFVLLFSSIQNGALQAAVKNPSANVLEYATSMSVSGLLTSTNAARANSGATALKTNSKLNSAAQAKANDMATRNYWSHNTPEGNPPWVFVADQGYSYQKLGENLAAGFSSEQTAVNGWLASPPHKKNMLDPAFSEVGFGYANNANYTSAGGGPMTIVVAFYGRPVNAPPAAPPASPPPAAQTNGSSSQPAPAQPGNDDEPSPASQPPAEPQPAPVEEPEVATAPQAAPQPANTDVDEAGPSLAFKTSRAQLAFADAPVSGFATGIVIFLMISVAGFWVGRHVLAFRRLASEGKSFALKHPLLDLGLILIIVILFLLTRTAGFIQ